MYENRLYQFKEIYDLFCDITHIFVSPKIIFFQDSADDGSVFPEVEMPLSLPPIR